MDDPSKSLTAARIGALMQEMGEVEVEIRELVKPVWFAPRHLREAAQQARDFGRDAVVPLRDLRRALKREERPLEEKVRALEDALDRLTHPEETS
jgi:phosphate uptake regulator